MYGSCLYLQNYKGVIDMAGAKRGLNVLISIKKDGDYKVVGGQRGATLNRASETLDVSNKATGGAWKEFIAGAKEWSIDCDGILIDGDDAFELIEESFLSGEVVEVKVGDEDGWGFEGNAIITDFPVEAPYDDALSYSMTLQGTGELKKASTFKKTVKK